MSTESDLTQRFEQRGLKESTQVLYESIIGRIGDKDPVNWLKSKMGADASIGTVLPARAAVKHFMIAEMGYSADELDALLPKAEGHESSVRGHLSEDQLALYHHAVNEIEREPAHTILHLLPLTGLKIGELCALTTKQVEYDCLRLSDTRVIPFSSAASSIMNSYIASHPPNTDLVFGIIGPPAIRKYTRNIASKYPELEGLSPEVLRQTFIQIAISAGMKIEELRDVLGHKNTQTTRRYLEVGS